MRDQKNKEVEKAANKLMLDEDPLQFWKQHSPSMPHLSALARKVLAVTAASTCPERFHSVGENVVSKKRCSLTADMASLLIVSRFRNQHVSERRKKRLIKWPFFGEVDDVEKMKDLGDWEYDPTAVYDSDDESEDEEENDAGGAAENVAAGAAENNAADNAGNTQTTDAETANTQNNEAENADGGEAENAGAATRVEFYEHPTGKRVRVRNRRLDEYVWGRSP